MAWNNLHKWIVRYSDIDDVNTEDFCRYAELESLDCTTNSGNSIYHLAVMGKSSTIVKYLLKIAPHYLINQTNDRNESPLHWASRCGNACTILALLQNGAVVNQKDNNGNTPLHFAAEAGNYQAVKLLINAGADMNLKNDDNISVLKVACEEREKKIIRYLVRKGAACYDELSYYVALNDSQIVRYLLKMVEPTRCVDRFNHNPLHIAVIHNKYKIAKLLLEQSSVWISSKDKSGKTPADLLRSNSDKRLKSLLVQAVSVTCSGK